MLPVFTKIGPKMSINLLAWKLCRLCRYLLAMVCNTFVLMIEGDWRVCCFLDIKGSRSDLLRKISMPIWIVKPKQYIYITSWSKWYIVMFVWSKTKLYEGPNNNLTTTNGPNSWGCPNSLTIAIWLIIAWLQLDLAIIGWLCPIFANAYYNYSPTKLKHCMYIIGSFNTTPLHDV